MWIVRLALRRPYTFIVGALLLVLASLLSLRKTPVDVFPEVDIPVVAILLSYTGLSAREMADRVVVPVERNLANSVSDMEHVESQTTAGLGVIKVYFQPQVDSATAISQLVASTQAALRSLPPGSTPPTIVKYSATNLPILQLGISSDALSDGELNDLAFNELRPRLITIPGVAVTAPYGGRFRQVSVDLDGPALLAHGLTPVDVVDALSTQNLNLPTGTVKIADTEFTVALNAAARTLEALGDIPIRRANGRTLYVRDVAQVRDGSQPQTTTVRRDGQRGLLMTLLKNGGASTLGIIDAARERLPQALTALPPEVQVTALADQSVFVTAALRTVVVEALIASALIVVLVLLFLGNLRATFIIAISIPLSMLAALLGLYLAGQTINIMALGGLALAVGILVDDAAVEIENVERHLSAGKPIEQAILDGAAEVAAPAFVSTLCICATFLPLFLLSGVARYLFLPLALAVVFAMAASYLLSRTLVPTLAFYWLRHRRAPGAVPASRLQQLRHRLDECFARLRESYTALLAALLLRWRSVLVLTLAASLASTALFLALGRDFFPRVDAGQMRLHVRAPVATRIEEMPALADAVQAAIREQIPATEIDSVIDVVGGPYSPFNTLYNNNGTFDSSDIEILIALRHGHAPTAGHERRLRAVLPRRFPGVEFYFQPADMISQTLNFGLAAPIDIQFSGNRSEENLALAGELLTQVRQVRGAVDAFVYQRFNRSTLALDIDRSRLLETGLRARDVAQNLLISLSSSYQTTPTQWLNPANGNVYNVAVQTRQHELGSLDALLATPVDAPATAEARAPQRLGDVARVAPTAQAAVVSRRNLTPVIDLLVGVDGRDLGRTYADVEKLIDAVRPRLPRGSEITVRGQITALHQAYSELGAGMGLALVLVYLVIVVNFQSWRDAFAVVASLPCALAGIAWMLFLSDTPLSVPALTGGIVTVGIAVANGILVVSFARERRRAGDSAFDAALQAGATRLRPVLMTALAMIVGMLPMALGLGEGGEQNAPLGRAVIGGLCLATLSTLLLVPLLFAAVQGRRRSTEPSLFPSAALA